MIRIMARLTATREGNQALRAILAKLAVDSRNENGCLHYEVFQDQDDKAVFMTVEQWSSDAAADAHMLAPHTLEAIAQARPLLAHMPLIHRFAQVA